MGDYNQFAQQYQQSRSIKLDNIVSHSFMGLLGDIKGKSVLDLACGYGESARQYKRLGAERVTGVDISDEMLKLAHHSEQQNPLGIEYIHCPVESLGKIGEFDVITAMYLLHYAQSKEQLLQMCRSIYHNLKSGQRFITTNNNPRAEQAKWLENFNETCEKYGCGYEFTLPLDDSSVIKTILASSAARCELTTYHYSQQTYEWALSNAGFKSIQWHDLQLPEDMAEQDGHDYWAFYFDAPMLTLIECYK